MQYRDTYDVSLGITITFPPAGQMARQSINRSQLHQRYKGISHKATTLRTVRCESKAEIEFQRMLECMPDVLDYREQPATINFLQNGAQKRHFPDFLVDCGDHYPTFVEVKPHPSKVNQEIIDRTQLLSENLPKLGFRYRLVTMSELPTLVVENCHTLLLYARRPRLKFLTDLPNDGSFNSPSTWGSYLETQIPLAAQLILSGHLHINMNAPLESGSIVSLTPPSEGKLSWKNFI
ncbi:TnsA endonuclease N-terminal domain-containing protein [Methylobacillus caricis]|uniref:TnsA endonuclease N-terminal domain-containing protein n=1 Tax=Methylobacillus caricis TaxID=1971611 RepID=UPI001CFF9FA7|nr:TnsA endonuclease N-terminal domain-containing protein [Methylobacillus caricis]MCB5188865.1 TnsA endonuclease N-terminal domain-containing protein [Methylobacillus caricis]